MDDDYGDRIGGMNSIHAWADGQVCRSVIDNGLEEKKEERNEKT